MSELTLRAEPLLSLSFLHGKNRLCTNLVHLFEVAVAPFLGLVIPVYSRQTGFSSASIKFWEEPMIETEPAGGK